MQLLANTCEAAAASRPQGRGADVIGLRVSRMKHISTSGPCFAVVPVWHAAAAGLRIPTWLQGCASKVNHPLEMLRWSQQTSGGARHRQPRLAGSAALHAAPPGAVHGLVNHPAAALDQGRTQEWGLTAVLEMGRATCGVGASAAGAVEGGGGASAKLQLQQPAPHATGRALHGAQSPW